jgi:hypothetical protein
LAGYAATAFTVWLNQDRDLRVAMTAQRDAADPPPLIEQLDRPHLEPLPAEPYAITA